MKIAPNPQLDMFAAPMTQLGSRASILFAFYKPLRDIFCWLKMIYKSHYSATTVCYVSLGMLAYDNTDYYYLNKTTTF